MIEGLKKESVWELCHYINGEKFLGKNELMHGNCADLCGDCSSLSGDCSGLKGDCTGLWGDLDLCKITDLDRQSKINLDDLIQ